MESATRIRKRGVEITVSPTFLDYYERSNYVTADAVEEWVEVCVGRICATYTRRKSWRLNRRIRCRELRELHDFLERALSNAPDWPVFYLVAEAAKSLELLARRPCGGGWPARRHI